MAPSAIDIYPTTSINDLKIKAQEFVAPQAVTAKLVREPLKPNGALDEFESFDLTPVIGKEFPKANLAEWLNAPNADELIRDLAITGQPPELSRLFPKIHDIWFGFVDFMAQILAVHRETWLTWILVSQRGVVFFRAQDDLTNDLQKALCQKLGELTGKPADSTMHIHPISNQSFQCNKDDEISVISNDLATKIFCDRKAEQHKKKQSLKKGWHSDITFESVPSDYAILKLTDVPTLGGGTYNI